MWNGQNASFSGNQNQPAWGGSGFQNQPGWGGSGVAQQDWGGSGAGQMAFPSSQSNFGGSGIQQMAFSSSQPNFGGSGIQQMAFPEGQQAFEQPSNGSDNSFWSQNMATRNAGKQQSLLPVPFQGPQNANEQALSMLPTAFPTLSPSVPRVNSLVPALPETDQEAPVYVAPMYTKPRPIIPRYRAISGLISMIIVCSLLCAGAAYYGQTTGKFTFFEKLFGNYAPPPVSSAHQNTLPVPSSQITQGPAAKIIYSVGISNRVNNGQIPVLINQFTVGETIYLVCGANTGKQAGTITIKWYSDNHFYKQETSSQIPANQTIKATFQMVYGLPAEGKAEVYWNNDLAATVLFVVEPAAA